MSLQPAATVNDTFAVLPVTMIELDDVTVALAVGQVGGGVEQLPFVSLVSRACAGLSPFPQRATSCTFSHTTVAEPAANVPENLKPLSVPKWPFAISFQVEPWSVDAQTRTSGFVRDDVVASEPFQAVAVNDTLPWQSRLAAISEWQAAAVDASQPASVTAQANARRSRRFTFSPLVSEPHLGDRGPTRSSQHYLAVNSMI